MGDPRAARDARGARRRDARRRRRDVPGRLPQSARRPVPARRRRRRRARRDDRDRVPPGRACAASGCSRSRRSSAASVAVFLTYAVGRSARRERDAATLVLAGVTVTAFFTAWQTFVQQQNSETLQEVYSWILGNIPSTGWSDVVLILPYVAVARRRDPRAAPRRGRPQPRRRRGGEPRRRRAARAARARRGRHARDGGGGRRHRAHRVRRDHRPAHDPAPHRRRVPRAAPAVGHRRRGVPRARGRRRADRALAGGDPARRRHRVLRGAVLRARAAHDRGAARDAIELRGVTVELGGRPVVDRVDARRRAGRVARAHRAERRRQDDAPARDRPARPVHAARSRSAGGPRSSSRASRARDASSRSFRRSRRRRRG